jgi:putative serine protease PepD
MNDSMTPGGGTPPGPPAGPPADGWWSRPADGATELGAAAASSTATTRPVPPYVPPGSEVRDPWATPPGALGASRPADTGGPASPPATPTKTSRRPGWPVVVATAGIAGLLGALVGVQLAPTPATPTAETTPAEGSVLDTSAPVGRAPESIAGIAEAALPSVVSISTATGTGSGFITTDDGYIITNNHVIADSGDRGVQVALQDGRTVDADLIGTSPAYDLAVLDVDLTGLTPLALGNSDEVAVGDPVVAVGSPLGLDGTVTSGIVSATNRPVSAGGVGETSFISAIQTDAAINPGNSGGPLLDAQGRVVGVNSSIAALGGFGGQAGSIGLGFAIPINQARVTAEQIIADGEASYPVIGATLQMDPASDGAVIAEVVPGEPAAQAGLRSGDRVVAINGQPVRGPDELIVAIRTKQPGDTVSLSFIRSQQEETVEITLGSRVG